MLRMTHSTPPDLAILRALAQRICGEDNDYLSPDEVDSLAAAAALDAWSRFDPARGVPFVAFARHHVRGAVLEALRRRRRQWSRSPPGGDLDHVARHGPSAHDLALAHEVWGLLEPIEREVALLHGGGESLSSIARSVGRHPSWASRLLKRARARLRALERPGLSAGERSRRAAERARCQRTR
ncbi:MAG: hypothetical protein CSA66_08180 [Proteobacteria bacterium]|nr:MAG: hypothetical protein CSA66_08180 [Pseudomonadota bacterium]